SSTTRLSRKTIPTSGVPSIANVPSLNGSAASMPAPLCAAACGACTSTAKTAMTVIERMVAPLCRSTLSSEMVLLQPERPHPGEACRGSAPSRRLRPSIDGAGAMPLAETIRLHAARAAAALAALAACAAPAAAQPNPYAPVEWMTGLPRALGSVRMAAVDSADGVWLAERCGQNGCTDRPDVAPILRFGADGRWLGAFGAGLFVWPHGIHVDRDGNVWVTDARAEDGKGHQVFKFSPTGELLLA